MTQGGTWVCPCIRIRCKGIRRYHFSQSMLVRLDNVTPACSGNVGSSKMTGAELLGYFVGGSQ